MMNERPTTGEERHGRSTPEANSAADLPLPDLFKRFSTDVTTLIGQEMTLARAEFAAKLPNVQQSAGLFGAATIFGLGAFLALTATLVLALALIFQPYLAALIVTVVYGVAAAIAAVRGKAGLAGVTEPLPRVAEHLRADVETIKAGFERGR